MSRSIRFRTFASMLAVAVFLVAGCAMPMPSATQGGMNAAPAMSALVPVAGQLTVEGVRARPAPLEGGNGAAFFTILNGTDKPVRLASAASDVAATVELHETINEGGVMKMVPQPEGFEIPAGGIVELAPGGKHVMFIGLAQPLAEGDAFSVTLNFDDGQSMDVTVPVVAMTAMPTMGAGAVSGSNMMTGTNAPTGTNGMGDANQSAETPTAQP